MGILLLGLVVLVWVMSPSERRRRSLANRLQIGDSVTRVTELLGPPGARCPGSSLAHLARAFPGGWPSAAVETALQTLANQTRERLVYPVGRSAGAAACSRSSRQTEVGIDPAGRVRWVIAETGRTTLRLPPDFAPAQPGGATAP